MKKLMDKNKCLTRDEAFKRSGRNTKKVYNNEFKFIIGLANKHLEEGHTKIIYIDKNHPPNKRGLRLIT